MKLKPLLIAVPLLLITALAYLSSISGADEKPAPATLAAAGSQLTLNGSAVRTYFGIPVYQVGLYVIAPSKDAKAILSDRKKKRIQIRMLREVAGKKFDSTIRKNIAKNFSSEEQEKFLAENERFLACFVDKILAKECIVDIDYIPNQGTEVLVDGERADLIPGSDYFHTLLRMWIGEPLQKSIKHGLLGKPEV
ncbi:MAG: chalcone isomerase family protein [Verrucomicrobiales bacterium]